MDISFENYHSFKYLQEALKYLVDAIIPRTPDLAEEYGKVQYFGALDAHTDEYVFQIFSLYYLNSYSNSYLDMIRLFTLLKEFYVYREELPFTLQEILENVFSILSELNRFTLMGYYSEWSGYGETRLNPPDQRIFEFRPVSWDQVGYPGPSLGYRALRK